MFIAEAEGLQEMASSGTITVPAPVCYGTTADASFLVLDYIASGHGDTAAYELFGEQLAAMHRHSAPEFGWYRDNTIGSTPQRNTQSGDWLDFYREQRLGFQLELAARNGVGRQLQQQAAILLPELGFFFEAYQPTPALLHGDLWSGNYLVSDAGLPVIFDPAVYYGDREADMAMTELFGGFPAAFYAAYERSWPLDPGYQQRKPLYNLYHILNHFNLFGGGYAGQAVSMLQGLNRLLP
jgi:fructosamine-3-kinase